MPQTEVHPISGACRHMRGRYKLTTSHKSPFPEKRLLRYECERGHEIDNESQEELDKCFAQQVGCWKEDAAEAAEAAEKAEKTEKSE